jgi:DNA-binding NarL/FixJ family response regulator
MTVEKAVRAGARGYVLKGRGVASLCDAIRAVARGETYLGAGVSEVVLAGFLQGASGALPAPELTPREREILALVGEGHTSRAIADALGLKTKTVQNHRTNLMDKLGIHTTAGLVRYALSQGLTRR